MTLKQFYTKFPLVFFLIIWFVINLLQAYFTELSGDEAYYYLYAQRLDWGYFDHPPMIAAFIYLSSLFFDGELGVRLFNVLASTASVWILASVLDFKRHKERLYLFVALAFSMTIFAIYGFLTAPDVPLILFSSFFIWGIKQYLERQDWKSVVWLALAMSTMLYSKYHGVIFIFLFIIANPKVLKKLSFYAASFLGATLYIPHLWWQYQHNFPSITYHLGGHSSRYWRWGYVFEYPPNQLLVLGPLVAIPILIAMFKYKPKDAFERTMLFLFWGFLGFFFLMSFRSHVEPHWTALMALPALIIVPLYYADHRRRKRVLRLAIINAGLLLLLRILLMIPDIPEPMFHGNKAWAEMIAEKSEGQPVVVYGSYQYTSFLEFYANIKANCYPPFYYHKTQFDIWKKENELRHQKVLFISKGKTDMDSDSLETPQGRYYTYWINDYYSLQNLQFSFPEKEVNIKTETDFTIEIDVYNPYDFEVDLLDKKYAPYYSYVAINEKGRKRFSDATLSSKEAIIPPLSKRTFVWEMENEIKQEGTYYLRLIPSSINHPIGIWGAEGVVYCTKK